MIMPTNYRTATFILQSAMLSEVETYRTVSFFENPGITRIIINKTFKIDKTQPSMSFGGSTRELTSD